MNFNYNQKFNGKVYYSGPYWDDKEINAAIDSLTTGKWIVAGEKVNEFEKAFSRKFNVKYSQMVNSGSSANLVMLAGLKSYFGWKDDAEIIVSPVGFPTTIAPIYQNRLKPVFADIEMETLNFDIDEVKKKITNKTKAIFVSPVLGNPPNMDKLYEISIDRNIELIGDNCDSLGSKWNNDYIHYFYRAWSSSFYPAHHISTGEGGMVSTNNPILSKIFKSMVNWGRDCHCVGADNLLPKGTCNKRFSKWLKNYDDEIDHKYIFTNMGYNLKPLDLQGAIGLEQLKKFDEISMKRKENYEAITNIFDQAFLDIQVGVLDNSDPCWFGVPFITKEKHKLVAYLEENNIQTRNYFAGNILIHPGYEFLGNYKDYPNANKVLDEVFFIGCSPQYTDETIDYIRKVVYNYE